MNKYSELLSSQLEAFMVVAEHKSVHGGARAMHISQTAMTQRIHALERKLKITLFIRTRIGMQLTAEGEQLLRYCHVVTDYSNETLAQITNAGIEQLQRVKISGPTSIMTSRIIPNCATLMKQFPMLYITFNINDSDERVRELRNGISQFAILDVNQVTRDMAYKTILAENYLLVCTPVWKTRKLLDIIKTERIIDFDETDKTTINYLKQFDLAKHMQSDRLFVNCNESLCQMFMNGYGYGTLTHEFAAPYLKERRLVQLNSGKVFKNELRLAWYGRPKPPKYFSALIDAIK